MYDYITIERSYACGGHHIATILSKKLNFTLYDHNVLVETCKRLDMPYKMIQNMDEQLPIKTPFQTRGGKHLTLQEQIYNTESEIIREAAKEKGCIFVGRCASEILKDYNCLRVFITADLDFRQGRALNVEKLAPDNIKAAMHQHDVRRQKFFTAMSHAKWGDTEYFDIVLNSGKLGIEACADILAAACISR